MLFPPSLFGAGTDERGSGTLAGGMWRAVFFLTAFCTFSTGFNLFGARRGACRAVTMSSTPNQYDESKWAPQRLSAALQHLRAYTLDQAAGTMQRQLSSWTQALQRFRIEPSSTDEEVHSAPATWDEPDAALPDPRTEEEIREMRLAASVAKVEMRAAQLGSDYDEFFQSVLENYSEMKTRDRLVFKARRLQEQGEFRAAELLNRRADALSEQLKEKLAYSAELIGLSEAAEDARAGRQPTSFYRSQLERQYSVRRRPAPADPGQLAATASLFLLPTRGARIPPLAPRADASRCWQL